MSTVANTNVQKEQLQTQCEAKKNILTTHDITSVCTAVVAPTLSARSDDLSSPRERKHYACFRCSIVFFGQWETCVDHMKDCLPNTSDTFDASKSQRLATDILRSRKGDNHSRTLIFAVNTSDIIVPINKETKSRQRKTSKFRCPKCRNKISEWSNVLKHMAKCCPNLLSESDDFQANEDLKNQHRWGWW